VPGPSRPEWRAKWDRELQACWAFLLDRPEMSLTPRSELLRYARTAFPDAWRRRKAEHGRGWSHFVNGPSFPFAAACAGLLLFGILTGGFVGLRTYFLPPPYPDQERLVTLWQDFALGRRLGIPAATLREWEAKSTLMGGFAAYYQRQVPLSRPVMKIQDVHEARVTPDLFAVLNVKALVGRTFEPADAYESTPKAVLSYSLWQDLFDGDPGVIGRGITLDGRDVTIIGIMPRSFWFPSRRVQVWTVFPLSPEPPPGTPYLLNAMARVKPGVAMEKARAELRRLGAKVHIHWNGSLVMLSDLRDAAIHALQVFFWAVPGAILAALIAARWTIGRNHWRFWSYLAAKTAVVYGVLALVWIDVTGPRTIGLTGWLQAGFAWLSTWWFLTASILLVWWSVVDQKRRCPVCFSRLAMPVTIGSYSSPMLDPVNTELVCHRGHGTLVVPGGLSTEPGEWHAMDSSWRDFFSIDR
jgi:hypothetical protein